MGFQKPYSFKANAKSLSLVPNLIVIIPIMKRILPLILLSLFLVSCGTSRKSISVKDRNSYTNNAPAKAVNIADYAMGFVGTKYKYGGTTRSGMDCSGLINTSFRDAGQISLPRTTEGLSRHGKKVKSRNIAVGDLVFFKTNKNRNVINHAGIVVDARPGGVKFIHSSTSRGVMVSGLSEPYWRGVFIEARRMF